jgi:DNA-binding response OmpR family regulator
MDREANQHMRTDPAAAHVPIMNVAAKKSELLCYVLRHQGMLAPRNALLEAVWGAKTYVGGRTMDAPFRRFREKPSLLVSAMTTVTPSGHTLRHVEGGEDV